MKRHAWVLALALIGCGGSGAGGDAGSDGAQGNWLGYYYVLVQDQAQSPAGDHPGASIDAIELASNGSSVFLAQLHETAYGTVPPTGDNANFNNTLGAPEGQCVGQLPASWDAQTFVSLGGAGGYLIGSFTGLAPIETGDQLTVHVCSDAASEAWDAYVGVGTTISDASWFQVINGGVATTTATIPALPMIPAS